MNIVLAALAAVAGCVLLYWAVRGNGPAFLTSAFQSGSTPAPTPNAPAKTTATTTPTTPPTPRQGLGHTFITPG